MFLSNHACSNEVVVHWQGVSTLMVFAITLLSSDYYCAKWLLKTISLLWYPIDLQYCSDSL